MRWQGPVMLFLVLGGVLCPHLASAQQGLEQGSRYRITVADGRVITGTVSDFSNGELRVVDPRRGRRRSSLPRAGWVIAMTDIVEYQQSQGTKKNFFKGFGLSVLSAAALGGIIGAAAWEPCEGEGLCLYGSREELAAAGAVLGGGLVGAPIGVLVGLAGRKEIWGPPVTPTSRGPGLTVTPVVGRGVGWSASIRF